MHPPIYSFSHPLACPFIHPSSIFPSIYPFLHPPIYSFIHPSIYSSNHSPTHPPIHQSINYSTHLPTLSSTNPLIHTWSHCHPTIHSCLHSPTHFSIYLLASPPSTSHISPHSHLLMLSFIHMLYFKMANKTQPLSSESLCLSNDHSRPTRLLLCHCLPDPAAPPSGLGYLHSHNSQPPGRRSSEVGQAQAGRCGAWLFCCVTWG